MTSISAVVLASNEEKNIRKCLQNLKWCNEILVIDDYSKDKTVQIAKKEGAKVFKRKLNNNFALQRNYGLSKTKSEWVLFIDADEVATKSLRDEILNLKFNIYDGFFIKRKDYFLRKEIKYGEVGKIRLLRLGKKKQGKWKRMVHEYWSVKGKVGELKNPLLHFSHPTISEFIEDINKYSNLHAKELKKEKKKSNLFKIVIWPVGKFIYNYFFELGFLDGKEGFIIGVMMSFHSFLAWSKIWSS